MITFLIGVFVLWLIWRWLSRPTYVEIVPPPPAVVVLAPGPITIHVYIQSASLK